MITHGGTLGMTTVSWEKHNTWAARAVALATAHEPPAPAPSVFAAKLRQGVLLYLHRETWPWTPFGLHACVCMYPFVCVRVLACV